MIVPENVKAACSKDSLSEDISVRRWLMDLGIFWIMLGGWLDLEFI